MGPKKIIAIVTHGETNCGIYNHGLVTAQILQQSNKYDFVFAPVAGKEAFIDWYRNSRIDALLWNYHTNILGWVDDELIKELNIPQFMITGHDGIANFASIDHFFVCDPTFIPTSKYSPVARPIVFYPDIQYSPPEQVIKIGSFGFGQHTKNFPMVVDLVNSQFDVPVQLSLHISYGAFVDPSGNLAHEIADHCRAIAKDHVDLTISHAYVDSNFDMVSLLNKNDLNVLCYSDMPGRGTSSCVDLLLAAKKPIAVSNSNMFRHINFKDEVLFERNSFHEIISRGIAPLEIFYSMWANDVFIEDYERIFDKFIKPSFSINCRVSKVDLPRSSFKAPFPGFEQVETSFSQAGQDLFVISMLQGKKNGTYLEIGCNDPVYSSNTLNLEKIFGWRGISIDIQASQVSKFNSVRGNLARVCDATTADYVALLHEAGIYALDIDYASVDCEPSSNTFAALKRLPLDTHRFAVLTYEHDSYVSGPEFKYRSREYLESKGYILVVGNVSASSTNSDFEDWWVHPDLVDATTIDKIRSVGSEIKDWKYCLF